MLKEHKAWKNFINCTYLQFYRTQVSSIHEQQAHWQMVLVS